MRPVLEAAIVVARTGAPTDPPTPAPPALRPFLEFRRLPARALEAARRVLDDDESFRGRVHDAVDLDLVGEAGRLFLERPEGWRERYEALVVETSQAEAEAGAARELVRLKGELAQVRARLLHAEAEIGVVRGELERARGQLAEDRRARQGAAEDAAETRAQLDRLRDERSAAVRELEQVKARDAGRVAAVRQVTDRLAEVETELASLRQATSDAPGPGTTGPDARATGPDLDALREAMTGATDLAAGLTAELQRARRLLGESPLDAGAPPPAAPGPPRPARRRPAPLPGGLHDDSPEAALALLRTAGLVVLVDGYNLSLRAWSDLPLAHQRDRAVAALDALGARTGCDVVIVFDSAEVGAGPVVSAPSRSTRVVFSAPDVEADDVILDAIGTYPVTRPVAVVSNDHRVRDGARARGANVLGVDQVLALLRP